MRLLIALALLLHVATASARFGPSFSCDGKLSAAEQLICANDEASYLDGFLSLSYRQLREWLSAEEWKEVVAEQRQWLAERDRCPDTACVVTRIKERSNALGQRYSTAWKQVESQLADQAFVNRAVTAGIAALRKKYDGIDDEWFGPLDPAQFECNPIGYHKARCSMSLGHASCNDGSRGPGFAGFDVITPSSKDFKLAKVEAIDPCGTELPTRGRR